jgi:DNA-binding MarR family transcriptional regulator
MIFDPQHREHSRSARISMALIRLSHAMKKMMHADSGGLELSPVQIQTLLFTAYTRSDVATVGSLANAIGTTHVTAVKVIQGLVRKGLLIKSPKPEDRRVTLLALTPKGEELVSQLDDWGRSLEESLTAMTDPMMKDFEQGLGAILASLQKRGHLVVAEPCAGCVHFHPHAGDPAAPHYCQLIRKYLTHEASLLECPEHTPSGA